MEIKKYIGIVKNYHGCMSGCRIELLSKFYDDHATFQQWFNLYPESEHIILENMHEPIIDIETWNKAQDKLNGYSKTRNRKYDHQLKGLVYCGECGNKATLRCREEKRKNGTGFLLVNDTR